MLTLTEIKKHLNIDSGFTLDDAYLLQLGEVAEIAVANHADQDLTALAQGNAGEIPAPLKQAALLMVGNLYNNREAVTYTTAVEVPLAYNYLLQLYRDYNRD